jgi:hypothetical protein
LRVGLPCNLNLSELANYAQRGMLVAVLSEVLYLCKALGINANDLIGRLE